MLLEKLPQKNTRQKRAGEESTSIRVRVKVVTPILGGAARTRELDDVDGIRPSSIRGHLRFWWRALYGHTFKSSKELFERESSIWGGATKDDVVRSQIEVRIEVNKIGEEDDSQVNLATTPGAYAIWTARETRETPAASRRKSGSEFQLTLIFPNALKAEICNATRAWILFGGYGGRTRRGLGSLTILDNAEFFLPPSSRKTDIESLFSYDIFAPSKHEAPDVPTLSGASLYVGSENANAESAWIQALEWLKEFRQGHKAEQGNRAREPGSGNRPSISNWPEPDKIRRLSRLRPGLSWAHEPVHNANPVWPRAGFGLPINGQFQRQSRQRGPDGKKVKWEDCKPSCTEPGNFQLIWKQGKEEKERLASPLIVKAMPLANGKFVPIALWLNRAYPNGEVLLKGNQDSAAPFDKLVADGDKPRFKALENKSGLRQAFMHWLKNKDMRIEVIAP